MRVRLMASVKANDGGAQDVERKTAEVPVAGGEDAHGEVLGKATRVTAGRVGVFDPPAGSSVRPAPMAWCSPGSAELSCWILVSDIRRQQWHDRGIRLSFVARFWI